MKERMVDIATPDGPMDTFTTRPEQGGPFPSIVIFMDIWGLREELFDIARRVATVGYYCLVPNFYHRAGKVRFEFRNAAGRMISFDRLEAKMRARMETVFHALSNAMVVSDVAALIGFIDKDSASLPGAMGGIGYCMGGRHVLCAAASFPDRFVASASLHGTALKSEQEDSPHRLARRVCGSVYCGYGEKDRHTPPGLVNEIKKAFSHPRVHYDYLIHPEAEHGYALPDRDVFDKQAANRDWERIFAMFRRQLGNEPEEISF
jgi:carboxymethylenebutenolidase